MNTPTAQAGPTAPTQTDNPGDTAGGSLEQHPRTTDAAPPGAQAPPAGGAKKDIKDLKPGEPPPESSAGS